MDGALVVAAAFWAAVGAQLMLCWWLARIYPTIPAKIPYGTAGNRYFLYGPRAFVWSAPLAWLLLLGGIGIVLLEGPAEVRAQPLMAVPSALMAAATPVIAFAIKDKIEAARRQGS